LFSDKVTTDIVFAKTLIFSVAKKRGISGKVLVSCAFAHFAGIENHCNWKYFFLSFSDTVDETLIK